MPTRVRWWLIMELLCVGSTRRSFRSAHLKLQMVSVWYLCNVERYFRRRPYRLYRHSHWQSFFLLSLDFIAQISGCDLDDLTPELKQATIDDLRRIVSLWGPLLASWKITHELLDLEDVRRHWALKTSIFKSLYSAKPNRFTWESQVNHHLFLHLFVLIGHRPTWL